jgi:hypothetical protein
MSSPVRQAVRPVLRQDRLASRLLKKSLRFRNEGVRCGFSPGLGSCWEDVLGFESLFPRFQAARHTLPLGARSLGRELWRKVGDDGVI